MDLEPGNHSSNFSCPNAEPRTQEMLRGMDAVNFAVLIFMTLLTVVGNVLCLQQFCNFKDRTEAMLVVMSIPIVVANLACAALWMPRVAQITEYSQAIVVALGLYKFLIMMVEELGGKEVLVKNFHSRRAYLNTFPCCCCCPCLPSTTITRSTLCHLKMGMLQAVMLFAVLRFLSVAVWLNEDSANHVTEASAPIWIEAVLAISITVSLWPLAILYRLLAKPLAHKGIVIKHALVQAYFLLIFVQTPVINILAQAGVIPCKPPYTGKGRAMFWNQFLLILEMFILNIISWRYYRIQQTGDELSAGGLSSAEITTGPEEDLANK